MGRGPVRAERVFSLVLHADHIVKYITSQSILACYKRTESCFARQDVESGSRTLAKKTFPLMPSLKLQYLHVHFPLGNYCSARNIHHSMVHRGASLCGPKLIGTGHRGKQNLLRPVTMHFFENDCCSVSCGLMTFLQFPDSSPWWKFEWRQQHSHSLGDKLFKSQMLQWNHTTAWSLSEDNKLNEKLPHAVSKTHTSSVTRELLFSAVCSCETKASGVSSVLATKEVTSHGVKMGRLLNVL